MLPINRLERPSTKHVVLWEDDGSKSTVLLQKVKGGKGQRFHLESESPGNPVAPAQHTKDAITLKTQDMTKYAIGQMVHNLGTNNDLSGTVVEIDRNAGIITVRLGRA